MRTVFVNARISWPRGAGTGSDNMKFVQRLTYPYLKYYTPVKHGGAMSTASLRRSGGSLIMTIPQAYVEQNMLKAGSLVSVAIAGEELRLKPAEKRKSLAALLDATPTGLHRVDGWDAMPKAGGEM
jgi:antitoxin ChpS